MIKFLLSKAVKKDVVSTWFQIPILKHSVPHFLLCKMEAIVVIVIVSHGCDLKEML